MRESIKINKPRTPNVTEEQQITFSEAVKLPGAVGFCIAIFLLKVTSYVIYFWYPTYL